MRKVSTYRLVFILFFLSSYSICIFKSYLPYLNYYLNYNYISTNLCVNKAKPAMHCNGKCHLAKTIKKSEEENSSGKNSHTFLKLSSFQEMPVKDFQFGLKPLICFLDKAKTAGQSYASPVMAINAPPPKLA